MKYYILYQITNTLDGMIYVGCHQTDDIEDGYMGSGTRLKRAQEKYGLEVFEKTVLAVFESAEEMFSAESQMVNETWVSRTDTYNLTTGGYGGWHHVNVARSDDERLAIARNARRASGEAGGHITGSKKHSELLATDPEYKEQWLAKIRAVDHRTFLGKNHNDLTKTKIGAANSKHQKGSGNSNFGKKWIHSLEEKRSTSVFESELSLWLDKGWKLGRKMNFD